MAPESGNGLLVFVADGRRSQLEEIVLFKRLPDAAFELIARLCEEHVGCQWLCGGVGMNAKTLADFRVGHGAALEQTSHRQFHRVGDGEHGESGSCGAGRSSGRARDMGRTVHS